MDDRSLTVDPEWDIEVLKGLAPPIRLGILRLLASEGPLNVNDIGSRLDLPQSTVAANVRAAGEGRAGRSRGRQG